SGSRGGASGVAERFAEPVCAWMARMRRPISPAATRPALRRSVDAVRLEIKKSPARIDGHVAGLVGEHQVGEPRQAAG
ncbi:MAG TPA: hypothetical protein VKD72_10680, partial [Gemmataceae bacterium]|nr:hypothetical protein [Gemmataceae bacterium]